MPLKPAEKEVNPDTPWHDDLLHRKACADKLTALLADQVTALTVSLDGKWGSGKTFLLKRWQMQLTKEGYTAIYYNAWEDDFIDDPLASLICQLWQALGCKKGSVTVDLIKTLNIIAGLVIKLKVGDNVDLDIGVKEAIEQVLHEKTPESEVLAQFLQKTKLRMILCQKLNELAKSNFSSTKKPLIFIVDELDRCRPTFAIETLERIKHLFSIDHVVFVLGIDREQLGHSIKSVYGNIDVGNYLHRFIDLEFVLPIVETEAFFDWQMKSGIDPFMEQFAEQYGRSRSIIELWKELRANFKDLLCNNNFSLREIEHCCIMLRWVLNSNGITFGNAVLLSVLVVLKVVNKDMYLKYINNTISPEEVIDYLIPENSSMSGEYAVLMACMIYFTFLPERQVDDNEDQQKIAGLLEEVKAHNGITPSEHCAKCLLVADKQGCIDDDFVYGNQKWLWDSGLRKINQRTLHSLSEKIELGCLLRPPCD